MKYFALLIASVFLLSGCSAQKIAPPPPPSPLVLDGVKIAGTLNDVENARVARAYLTQNEKYKPFANNLPFGVILLKKNDDNRNKALCNAFVNGIPSPTDIALADPSAKIILTYWLLKKPLSETDSVNCDRLLEEYDFSRSLTIRSSYGRASANGPIILGLQLNEGLRDQSGQVIAPYVALMDLSGQPPLQVQLATMDWFNIVVSKEDDAAAAPDYQPEANRHRGFFGKIFKSLGKFFNNIGCSILNPNANKNDESYTDVAAIDPVIHRAIGTVRLFIQSTGIIGFSAGLLSDVLCPANTTLNHGRT